MKKSIVLILILFSVKLFSNPLVPYPVLSEIYFEGDNFTIELINLLSIYEYENLDNFYLCSSTQTVQFKDGITTFDGMLVTQDDLFEPLCFDAEGDLLRIYNDNELINEYVAWSNHSWAKITTPSPGQSIVRVWNTCHDPNFGNLTSYPFVKQTGHSPGTDFLQTNSFGTLHCYVYDIENNPILNAEVTFSHSHCWGENFDVYSWYYTDETGFVSENLLPYRQYIRIYLGEELMESSQIIIEPDSICEYTYVLDTLITDIEIDKRVINPIFNYNLTCYQNPFTDELNISFNLKNDNSEKDIFIKIYDLQGNFIDNIPFVTNSQKETHTIFWNNNIADGTYICILETNNQLVSSTKFILLK